MIHTNPYAYTHIPINKNTKLRKKTLLSSRCLFVLFFVKHYPKACIVDHLEDHTRIDIKVVRKCGFCCLGQARVDPGLLEPGGNF